MSVDIRYLSPEDSRTFRQIRLEALETEPDAFGALYADSYRRSDEEWKDWVANAIVPGKKNIAVAEEEGRPIAMCGFGISDEDPQAGFLWGMFVSRNHRRKGCGERLLKEAEDWLSANGGKKITACVAAPNEGAIRFYRKNGYTIGPASGTLRPGSPIPIYPIEKQKTTFVSEPGNSSDGAGHGDRLSKPEEIPTFETERLVLRPFWLGDASEVRRLAGDRAIADTTLTIPHPYEDGMAEAWISSHAAEFHKGTNVAFAIAMKEERRLVGAISLIRIEEGHQAELGYWIGKPYWNCGFCTEAGRAALGYAFDGRGLARVHARHLSRNPASGRVLQKLGMKHEGRLRQHVRKWGVLEDVEVYGILRDEWKE